MATGRDDQVDLGIVAPLQLSVHRIDGHDSIEAGGEKQRGVDEDGGSFESTPLFPVVAIGDIACVQYPSDFEL